MSRSSKGFNNTLTFALRAKTPSMAGNLASAPTLKTIATSSLQT